MNESLPPDGRRVSYKSLDSEAMAAARRAAEAAGLTLQEWLSRTILENARRSGIVPEQMREPEISRRPETSAEEAVQAIARHLERAKTAADTQGLSLADWLSRAILTNAGAADAGVRRARPEPPPAAPQLPAGLGPSGFAASGFATSDYAAPGPSWGQPPLPAARDPHSRGFRPRPGAGPVAPSLGPPEQLLPAASTVRDVLARAGPPRAGAPAAPSTLRQVVTDAQRNDRRRRTGALWASLVLLLLVAGGIWALPYLPKMNLLGEPGTVASATDAPARTDTARAADPPRTPDGVRPAEPPRLPESKAPEARPPGARIPDARPTESIRPSLPDTARPQPPRPPEAAEPAPERPADPARPPERADATPGTPSRPAERVPLLPEASDTDLAKVPAKDMPKPPGANADWYRRAADAGNAEAQYTLAELYLKGEGVPKDPNEAAKLFRAAAGAGNLARAQYALGLLYRRGLGVPRNDVEAVLWWQKAADQNYPAAITWVGLSLLEGRGIAKDEEAARRMLERAAEADEMHAQYTLCRIYERGIGVKKDVVVAMKWCILAAEQAHKEATQKVEELSTQLPREQQELATGLVTEFYQKIRSKRK